MKFIVDESTGIAVAEFLRQAGHDVLVVSEAMPRAEDQDILIRAVREERVVVTNDKDFGELIYRSCQAHHGVLLLWLNNESSGNRVRVVKTVLEKHSARLVGHFTVATESNIRIRSTDPFP